MKRVCLLAAMGLVAGSIAISGQIPEPLKGGERILWFGNSLMAPSVNGSMAFVNAAFPAINYTVETMGVGSGEYKDYWGGVGFVQKIQEGNWDIVVLQGHMHVFYKPDDFIKYGTLLAEEAKKVGAKVIFLWPQPDAWRFPEAYASGQENYPKLAAATGGFVAPCIEAWVSAEERYPVTNWGCPPSSSPLANDASNAFYADCIHANGNGNLLNAIVMYTVLTGGQKSPVGLRPAELTGKVGPYDPAKLDIILDIGYSVGLKALGQPVAARDLLPGAPDGLLRVTMRRGAAEVAIGGAGTATLELLGMDGTAVYRTGQISRSALVPLPRIAGTFILRATTQAGSVNRRVILVP